MALLLIYLFYNRLWLDTVNKLRRREETRKSFKIFTHEDLYQNPVAIILDCDTRVFRFVTWHGTLAILSADPITGVHHCLKCYYMFFLLIWLHQGCG